MSLSIESNAFTHENDSSLTQSSSTQAGNVEEIQAKFFTHQKQYTVTDSPFAVPTKLRRYGLSEVINHLLNLNPPRPFDFLIDGEFLRTSLEQYIQDKSISRESVLLIEYCEAAPPPAPLNGFPHEDWVSCVTAFVPSGLFLTGSYDNTVRVWNQNGKCISAAQEHSAPIKSLSIIHGFGSESIDKIYCATASLDHTLATHEFSISEGSHRKLHILKGHTGSVEAVVSHPNVALLCSGSWDKTMRLWTPKEGLGDVAAPPPAKRTRQSKSTASAEGAVAEAVVKDSIRALAGHSDAVTCLSWPVANTIHSGSADSSVRLWDVETGSNSGTLNCDSPVLSISSTEASGLIITGHSDNAIRVWDPRMHDGIVVKQTLRSHQGFVSGVSWCPESSQQFASSSFDNTVKLWDLRSKTPLHTITTHQDRVLCVYWGASDLIASGSVDKTMQLSIINSASTDLNNKQNEAHSSMDIDSKQQQKSKQSKLSKKGR